MTEFDRSDHPTVVEYAVQNLFKRQSIATAARNTIKKLSGTENLFLGPGVSIIEQKKLEEALWYRLVENAIKNVNRFKPGAERIALLSTLDHFKQPEKMETELRRRVAEEIGRDPYEPVHTDDEEDMKPNADLEWIKGDGVDSDGHNLTWWKNKLKKWKGEYDRPRAEIQVRCWDRSGQPAQDGAFALDDVAGAKAFAKEWSSTSGSARVQARIEIPYQKTYLIDIGEYRNAGSDGFYVWSVDKEGVPYDRRGPWERPDEAIGHAKVGARAGNKYDFVVTFGSDPEAGDFEIVKAFKAWSGEVHYATDLPRVGRRLGEYR